MDNITVGDFAYSKKANKIIKVTKIKGKIIEGHSLISNKSGHKVSKTVYQFHVDMDGVKKVNAPSDLQEESAAVSIKQLVEESIRTKLSEDRDADYETAKRRVQKTKKDAMVSFTTPQGEKKSGQYKGLANRGGRSYAKVEMGNGMTMVPVTQIH